MAKLEWTILTQEDVDDIERNRCNVKRGPRSKIYCEQDVRTHWTTPDGKLAHTGRNDRGYWYTWSP